MSRAAAEAVGVVVIWLSGPGSVYSAADSGEADPAARGACDVEIDVRLMLGGARARFERRVSRAGGNGRPLGPAIWASGPFSEVLRARRSRSCCLPRSPGPDAAAQDPRTLPALAMPAEEAPERGGWRRHTRKPASLAAAGNPAPSRAFGRARLDPVAYVLAALALAAAWGARTRLGRRTLLEQAAPVHGPRRHLSAAVLPGPLLLSASRRGPGPARRLPS
jgi:hypothetical protein